jgi:Spy/CpxP family protein refolding chaperone
MQRRGFLAIAGLLAAALVLPAQQAINSSSSQKPPVSQTPGVDEHMKMLSERLDLTPEQQARIKPVVQEMIETTAKLSNDASLTQEQKNAGMHQAMTKADRDARAYLTDDQKKKLDALESEMHPGHQNDSN